MFSLASGRSLNVERAAQPGRKPRLGEPPASGAKQSVPQVADGLLLPQPAELRENLRPSVERRSEVARGGLAPPLRPAGPQGRPPLSSVLEEAALKLRSNHRKGAGPASPRPALRGAIFETDPARWQRDRAHQGCEHPVPQVSVAGGRSDNPAQQEGLPAAVQGALPVFNQSREVRRPHASVPRPRYSAVKV